MVDEAIDMTAFGGREGAALSCGPSAHAVAGNAAPLSWGSSAIADAGYRAVDMVYVHPVLLGSVAAAAAGALMQNLHKTPKAQIGHFAAPHHLHTAQLQVF